LARVFRPWFFSGHQFRGASAGCSRRRLIAMRAETVFSNFDTGECICVATDHVANHTLLLWVATLSRLSIAFEN
jgi:hypothetical protein